MAERTGPTEKRPTAHIVLSDGVKQLGIILCDGAGNPVSGGEPWSLRKVSTPGTSLQIASGDTDRSQYEMPFTPVSQKNWGGGRGQKDLQNDATKFYDSYRIDTTTGKIFCGPKETVTSTLMVADATQDTHDGTVTINPASGGARYLACKFTPGRDGAIRNVHIWLTLDNVVAPVTVVPMIYNSNGTSPTTVLGSIDQGTIPTGATPAEVVFGSDITVQAGHEYWLVLLLFGAGSGDLIVSANINAGSYYRVKYSIDGVAWTEMLAGSNHQAFRFSIGIGMRGKGYFVEHRGGLYYLTGPDDDSVPILIANGIRGMAKDNAADKTGLNTDLDLTGKDLTGSIIQIVGGPGRTEYQNWRHITGNTQLASANKISVDHTWNVTHTTATEFVVIKSNAWTTPTAPGFSTVAVKPPTCVVDIDDIIYVCQGEDDSLIRGRVKTDGTWDTWVKDKADGSVKASFLISCPDINGKKQVVRALATAVKANYSNPKAWGTELSFASAEEVTCGNTNSRITNLIAYESPKMPYVIKENAIGSLKIDDGASVAAGTKCAYGEKTQPDLENLKDDRNGRGVFTHDVYLYIPMMDGLLERYFNDKLDDISPIAGEGLPANRRGPVSAGAAYAGRFFIAIDAGWDGYSSIMCSNTVGGNYHEFYRAPLGKRIRSLHVQTIPGAGMQRLWFNQDEDLVWIPLAIDPLHTTGYPFFSGGKMISSWINGTYREVVKFWDNVLAYVDQADAGQRFELSYQIDGDPDTDDETQWKYIGAANASPSQKLELNPKVAGVADVLKDVVGKQWRWMGQAITDDELQTPRMIALTINNTTRVKAKDGWQLTFIVDDAAVDLAGIRITTTVQQRMQILKDWADHEQRAGRLLMTSMLEPADRYNVFTENPGFQPILMEEVGGKWKTKLLCSMQVYEA